MTITAAPRKKQSGERYIANLAYFIAIQCRVPALAWGGTGVAKSQGIRAVARAMDFQFYSLIGSCHAPEDFGGIPFPVYEEGCADLLPMRWVRKTTTPKWVIFFDEVTTIPQQVRPVTLSMLSEREIGGIEMHPTTIMCGACNPPELAPNASPLEKSMLNRFYHHNWVMPMESFLKGMRRDQNFEAPEVVLLPETWQTYTGKWSTLVADFLDARPTMAEHIHTADDDRKSFPSPRAWSKAALLLAGAESVNAPAEVYCELLSGMIGTDGANEFLAYCSTIELYSPEEIVEGTKKVDWKKARFDVIACLPSAVIGAIKRENNANRFGNAVKFFVELCEHEADLALYPLEELMPMMPADGQWDRKAATVFGEVLRQVRSI